jgi:uncharacterized protein YjbI with pentapeptide repeats
MLRALPLQIELWGYPRAVKRAVLPTAAVETMPVRTLKLDLRTVQPDRCTPGESLHFHRARIGVTFAERLQHFLEKENHAGVWARSGQRSFYLFPRRVRRVYRDCPDDRIQKILDGHQEWVKSGFKEGARASLRGVFLPGRDLSGLNLQKADLREAELGGSNLFGTSLEDADLRWANLEGANLQNADLQEARLRKTKLYGATLSEANLERAILTEADLRSSVLSGGKLGEAILLGTDLSRASLQGAELSEAKLPGANLRETLLWNADLTKADLMWADLQGADLQGADLQEADLTDATLWESILRSAKLKNAVGLQAQHLARANTSDAKLPEDIARFDGLRVVDAASESTRKLFIALGLACAYAILAISTEPVNAEAGTEPVLKLPFVNVNLGLLGFYCAIPLLLALSFGYFHLQMQRLWEEISRLPAIFPDGKSVDQKIRPWLLTGIVRAHIPHLDDEVYASSTPIAFFNLQLTLVTVLAWGLAPATQAYFVVRFTQRFPDEHTLAVAGSILVVVTLLGAIVSWVTVRHILRGTYRHR